MNHFQEIRFNDFKGSSTKVGQKRHIPKYKKMFCEDIITSCGSSQVSNFESVANANDFNFLKALVNLL